MAVAQAARRAWRRVPRAGVARRQGMEMCVCAEGLRCCRGGSAHSPSSGVTTASIESIEVNQSQNEDSSGPGGVAFAPIAASAGHSDG